MKALATVISVLFKRDFIDANVGEKNEDGAPPSAAVPSRYAGPEPTAASTPFEERTAWIPSLLDAVGLVVIRWYRCETRVGRRIGSRTDAR